MGTHLQSLSIYQHPSWFPFRHHFICNGCPNSGFGFDFSFNEDWIDKRTGYGYICAAVDPMQVNPCLSQVPYDYLV